MSKPRLWLSCPPLEPVPVGIEPVIVGRDPSCSLQLLHQAVSRKHGLVRAVGNEVVYENKSKQGTFINDAKVTFMAKLQPGDVVEIGPYTIRALAEPPETRSMEGTLTITLDKDAVALRAKLKEAMQVVRKLEQILRAKAAEAQAKAEQAEQAGREAATTRRELESEVWRGFATNRELNEARERVAELQQRLEALGDD